MLYFFLGFFFGGCFLLALYLTAKTEYVQQRVLNETRMQESRILLDFLHSLFESIAQGASTADIYQKIISGSRSTTHGVSARFFKYNALQKTLTADTYEGTFPLLKTNLSRDLSQMQCLEILNQGETFFMGESYIGQCAQYLKTCVYTEEDLEFLVPSSDPKQKMKLLLLCPITCKNELFGVVAIANSTRPEGFPNAICTLLKAICEQAGIILNNVRQLEQLLERKSLEFDLNLAHHVQNYLLPKFDTRQFPSLDVDIVYKPSQKVGGDLYNIVSLNEHRTAIFIGDVSGKGVPAALIMTSCLTYLKHCCHAYDAPLSLLKMLNREILNIIPQQMFITLCYAIIDTKAHTIECVRAGHEYPLLVHGETIEKIKPVGMPLGLMPSDIFDTSVQSITVPFVPGDRFILYTDGLTEVRAPDQSIYTDTNLERSIKNHLNENIQTLNQGIISDVNTFVQSTLFSDDITLISIAYKEGN